MPFVTVAVGTFDDEPPSKNRPKHPNDRKRMFSHTRVLLLATLIGTIGLVTACSTSGDLDATPTTVAETTTTPNDDTTTTTESEDTTTTTESEDTTTTTEAFSRDRDELIDELTDAFLDEPSVPFEDRDVARCVATEFVDLVGDDLETIDFDDFEMDEDTALAFATSFRDCGFDTTAFFTESLVDGGATEKQAACVLEKFGADNIDLLVALGMSDGDMDQLEGELDAAYEACT